MKKMDRVKPNHLFGFVLLLVLLPGCEAVSNRQMGAGIGGVTGAVIGHQFGGGSGQYAASAIGAMLGSWVGIEIGYQLDKQGNVHYQPNTYKVNQTNGHYNTIIYDPTTKRVIGYDNQIRGNQVNYMGRIQNSSDQSDDNLMNGWENR